MNELRHLMLGIGLLGAFAAVAWSHIAHHGPDGHGERPSYVVANLAVQTPEPPWHGEPDTGLISRPERPVLLRVSDEHGAPSIGSFLITDNQGRVYPPPNARSTPDFAFHPQVYRADGEFVNLPDGAYEIQFRRGPESIPETRRVVVDGKTTELAFQVKRWIDPAAFGWWSGDHHIHAAGCSHYSSPARGASATDGVMPDAMARQIKGEDLKIGATLTWGPGFDYQKQFFTGREDEASEYPYLIRYDVEISGFGAFKSVHLCLLRLTEQVYPGGDSIHHWPTLGMNIIRWAKPQGAIVGPAHTGWGLQPVAPGDDTLSGPSRAAQSRTITDELPNYVVPPFNGVGANEYIMEVTHEVPGPDGELVPAVDFLSLADTPHTWELNIWYHTLNAGFRTRAGGESDFPCIYDERVGLGRSYVKLDQRLSYDDWCEGIRAGRAYVSDGKSHLIDFKVDDRPMGEEGSELRLERPQTVAVTVRAAALLEEKPRPEIRDLPTQAQPYWHIERARIGDSREVPVEVIVNGQAVAQQTLTADGTLRELKFEVPIERSSWVALRIRASSHTNPVFVLVGGKPIRASRRSVQWCLDGVDQCWSQKEQFIAEAELAQARADYEHARQVYCMRLAECDVD